MNYDKDCIFCKISKGEIPSEKIYEDKNSLAFLDINPVNYGHVLIIPKEHYQWLYDVPDKILSDLFINVKKIMKVIKKTYNCDYVAISVVGLDVPHFHIHIIPRWKSDGLANFWPTKKYADEDMKKTSDKIKSNLK